MRAMRIILGGSGGPGDTGNAGRLWLRHAQPGGQLALSDTVLVGKVQTVESRTVRLRLGAGQEPLPHDVVVIKVQSMLRGDDRLTHVRVAVMKHQVMPLDFEGVFFLNAHPKRWSTRCRQTASITRSARRTIRDFSSRLISSNAWANCSAIPRRASSRRRPRTVS